MHATRSIHPVQMLHKWWIKIDRKSGGKKIWKHLPTDCLEQVQLETMLLVQEISQRDGWKP